jgi:LmbE family N-acetylglucosaminyl deacetylase
MTKRSILVVLAHPDDESFGMGGTLAYYARNKCGIYLICATRGEAGVMDPEHLGNFFTTADKREAELRCAAQILGLQDVYFLGYRDSGMSGSEDNHHPDAQINQPVEEVAGMVVKYIRAIKPDIVLTFDPIGGYRHPDHIHIQKATTLAFEKADDASFHPEAGSPFKPQALYYHVFPRGFLKWATRLMSLFGMDPRKWGRNQDIDLKSLADIEFPVHARIDISPVAQAKREAGACHASQGGIVMRRGWMGFIAKWYGRYETYMRAYPPVNGRSAVAKDLFEGIKGIARS